MSIPFSSIRLPYSCARTRVRDVLFTGLFFLAPALHAATCISAGSGNWSTITWTGCASGPQTTDTAVIASGTNVTLNVTVTVSSLTMASPTAADSLTILTGQALTVTNNLTFTPNAAANGESIIMQGTADINAGSIISSTSTSTGVSSMTCTSGATGTLNVTGNISLVGSGVASSTGTKIDFSAGACNVTAGTVRLVGGAKSPGLLKIGTGILTLNGAMTATGNFQAAQLTTTGALASIVLNGGSIGPGLLPTIAAGTDLTTTGTSSITSTTTITTWGDLTVQSGTLSFSPAGTFTSITINASSVLASPLLLTNSGNYTNNGTHSGGGGLQMTGTNTVLDGSGAMTSTGTVTLITAAKSFAATADLTFTGPIAISGAITVTNNGTVTINSTTGMTGTATGSTWVNAANATLNDAGPLLGTGTLTATATGNTVNYDQAGAQACKTTQYYNLMLGGSGAKTCTPTTPTLNDTTLGGTATWILTTALTLDGDLNISGGTLTTGAVLLTVDGNTTISAGTLSLTSSTGNKTFIGLVTVSGGTLSGTATTGIFEGGITQTSGSVAITGTATFSTNSQALNGTIGITTLVVATGITLTNNDTLTSTTLTATGSLINDGAVTVVTSLTGGGSWTQGAGSTLTTSATTTNAMAVATVDFTTNINTVTYSGAAQTVKAGSYSYLALSGSGAKTMTSVTAVNNDLTLSGTVTWTTVANMIVGGNLNINSGTTVSIGNFTLGISGDTIVNGTMSGAGTGTVTANGDVTGTGTINLTANTFEQRVSANQVFFTTSGATNWTFKALTFSNSGATPQTITTQTGGTGIITVSSMTIGKTGDTAGATTTLDPGDVTWTISGTGTVFTLTTNLGILCNHGTCPTNTSTFKYIGTTATTIAGTDGYYVLQATPTIAAAVAYSASGPITTVSDFLLNPTAPSTNRLLTLTLNGDLTVGGTLTLDGTTSACTAINTGTSDITATALVIQAGVGTCTDNLIANASNITLTGTGTPFTLGASLATFTRGTSTFTYTGNGATVTLMTGGTAATNSYTNIVLQPSGASPQVIGAGTLDVNGDMTIGDGTNTGATASGNPTIDFYGNLTIAANAVYTKGTGTTTFKKGATQTWTDNTTGQQDLGTVVIAVNTTNTTVNLGSSVQATALTINASQALSLNGSNTLFLSTLSNAGTLTGSSGMISLSGTGTALTNTGTYTYGTSTVLYTGNGANVTALSGAAGTNGYYNLQVEPGGSTAQVLGTAASQTIQVNNNFTVGDGTNAGASGATNNPTINVLGDTTISNGAIFTGPKAVMTIQGDWTNNGDFTANGSTLAFKGAAVETIDNSGQAFGMMIDSNTSTGGVVFASSFTATSLVINGAALASATTVYFNAHSTYTIAGLTLIGSSGKTVFMRSSTNGQSWYLHNSSTNTVSFVDVADSNASGGILINAGSSSTDSGNNVNWNFTVVISVSLSTHSYDFGTVAMGATTVSVTVITVTNGGSATETYALSVATTGVNTVWAVKTATPTVADAFALFSLFNSVQPSSSTFSIGDIVTSTPTVSSASMHAGDETGVNTPVSSIRHLWMRLDMPPTTSTTLQQQMSFTVTAASP